MEQAKDTRTRLLEAAIAVIEEDGVAAIHVRDVAATAGVTYASLYHFFGDREGLIEAAQAERFRRAILETIPPFAAAVARCRTREELVDVLRATLGRVYSPDRFSPRWVRVNVLGSSHARPRLVALLADAVEEQNRGIADALREPQRRGWIRRDLDLEMLAAWTTGQTTGRVLVELDPARFDLGAWDRISIEAVLGVVLGEAHDEEPLTNEPAFVEPVSVRPEEASEPPPAPTHRAHRRKPRA